MSAPASRPARRGSPVALRRAVRRLHGVVHRMRVRHRLRRAGRSRPLRASVFGATAAITGDLGLLDAWEQSAIFTRFIVLSEQRSGSTLLITELGRRWTEIRARREVFNPKRRAAEDTFATIARRTFITESGITESGITESGTTESGINGPGTGTVHPPIVGCKIFGQQITEQQLRVLLALPGMRVVILRRRNMLRRHTSQLIARSTGQWENKRAEPKEQLSLERRSVTVDTDLLLRQLRAEDLRFERFDQLTKKTPRMYVSYEDLSADLDGELRRIAGFLGAGEPAFEMAPKLTRQNPEPLSDLIRNYEDVARFVREIGHPEFLTLGEPHPGDTADPGDEADPHPGP